MEMVFKKSFRVLILVIMRADLKTGVENEIFGSEIGSGPLFITLA